MSEHIVVIGGGFAGASSASALAEAGYSVTLLEQKPILGGRAYSYKDGVTKSDIDNGQHLFLGCYRDTRLFLRRLDVEARLRFLPSLKIPFVKPGGRPMPLRCPSLPFSAGMLWGVAAFSALSLADRWALLRGLSSFALFKGRDLSSLTVSQWLDHLRQTPGARRAFWTPLCLATLNERPEKACAAALAVVLRQGFMGSSSDRALGYSIIGLSKLWPVELSAYLKRQEGVVAPRQTVTGFRVEKNRVTHALLENGESVQAQAFVSAVSLPAFLKICPKPLQGRYRELKEVAYSPIASINLWFSRSPFDGPLVGLLGTDIQWAFNRFHLWKDLGGAEPGNLALVLSSARDYAALSKEDLVRLALKDLRRCFPSFKEEPRHATVVWEKQATPSPDPLFWSRRPPVATALENFFLAGDWVDSGLPPTIEAACRSGHMAARSAREFLEKARPTVETQRAA